MKCPECSGNLDKPKIPHQGAEFLFLPVYCPKCRLVWMIDVETDKLIPQETVNNETKRVAVRIPPIKDGVPVYINNREHPLFLEMGEVAGRDHGHYRLKLRSLNPQLDGTKLWVPEHWVITLPKEMRRSPQQE